MVAHPAGCVYTFRSVQHRRSIILIDKRFQLRFAFYVCSWLFALSFVYPLIIHSLFEVFLKYLSLDPNGPTVTALQRTRQELLSVLVILQLVFLSVTFLISIFLSHKIAGPIFKLKKFMARLKEGDFSEPLRFRKADHFQEVAALYNEMTTGLKGVLQQDRDRVTQAITHVEQALERASGDGRKHLDDALTQLRQVVEHLPH